MNHPTSYWLPRHSTRALVERVDMVSGVGNDSAAAGGPGASRFHDLRRLVTNLGVFDWDGPEGTMRIVSLHPGVSREEVAEATGFELDGGRRRRDPGDAPAERGGAAPGPRGDRSEGSPRPRGALVSGAS